MAKRPRTNKPVDVMRFIHIHVLEDGTPDPNQCWEWKDERVAERGRRPYMSLNGKSVAAYRIMYELWYNEELNPSVLIRHKCDNPVCCNPLHLETGSHNENMQDMKERARHGITAHAVRGIRKLLADGKGPTEIAALYGINESAVRKIRDGDNRKEVD